MVPRPAKLLFIEPQSEGIVFVFVLKGSRPPIIENREPEMNLPAAPQEGSPLCSDKLQGILAKANKWGLHLSPCLQALVVESLGALFFVQRNLGIP